MCFRPSFFRKVVVRGVVVLFLFWLLIRRRRRRGGFGCKERRGGGVCGVDLSMVVDEAMVAGRAGRCDFRVGMRASGMGETRDSGKARGGCVRMQIHGLGHAPLATSSPTELLGETVRELGRSWRGSGSGLWYDGASHLVSSCHLVTESSFTPNH
jgi:hypothetical protein